MNFTPQIIYSTLATGLIGVFGYFGSPITPAPTTSPVDIPTTTDLVTDPRTGKLAGFDEYFADMPKAPVGDPVGDPVPPEQETYLKSGIKPSISPSKSVIKPAEKKKKKKDGTKNKSDFLEAYEHEQYMAEYTAKSKALLEASAASNARYSKLLKDSMAPIKIEKPKPLKTPAWNPVFCAPSKSGEKFAPRCK